MPNPGERTCKPPRQLQFSPDMTIGIHPESGAVAFPIRASIQSRCDYRDTRASSSCAASTAGFNSVPILLSGYTRNDPGPASGHTLQFSPDLIIGIHVMERDKQIVFQLQFSPDVTIGIHPIRKTACTRSGSFNSVPM